MTAEGIVLIITALGAQATMVLKQWQMSQAVGKSNGSGSLHEALSSVKVTVEAMDKRLAEHIEGHG